MGLFDNFPYSNLHELNLDWIIDEMKETRRIAEEQQLPDQSVTTAKIVDGAVTASKLDDGAVTASKIYTGAVTVSALADKSVTHPKLAPGAVETDNIADFAVTELELSDNAVSARTVAEGAITNDKLSINAVSTNKVRDRAITADKLADGAVTQSKIAAGVVIPYDIADGSITTAKLHDAAVTDEKLADSAVTTDAIADQSVTAAKLATGAVEAVNIAAGAVTGDAIAAGAVTADAIADGSITADKLAPGSVASYNYNMLDNPWFTINQRKATTYTVGKYGVDRWKLISGSASVVDGGIQLTGTLRQIVEFPEPGIYTASVKMTSGEATATYNDTTGYFDIVSNGGIVRAAKLEAGVASTLKNDVAPNYQTELTKCQRFAYLVPVGENQSAMFGGWSYAATNVRVIVPTAAKMRVVNPVFEWLRGSISDIHLRGAGQSLTPSGYTISNTQGNGISVSFAVSGATKYETYYAAGQAGEVLILASADL